MESKDEETDYYAIVVPNYNVVEELKQQRI